MKPKHLLQVGGYWAALNNRGWMSHKYFPESFRDRGSYSGVINRSMAGSGVNPSISLNGTGMKFAIVASRFNADITHGLVDGARKALTDHGVTEDNIAIIEVPGAFEIPLALEIVARKKIFDGLIALGAVIQGETKHFDYISEAAMHGIQRVMVDYGIAVGCGVLTTFTEEQAITRSSNDKHNKGREAALAALEMAQLIKTL